jgi:hypothetical protein
MLPDEINLILSQCGYGQLFLIDAVWFYQCAAFLSTGSGHVLLKPVFWLAILRGTSGDCFVAKNTPRNDKSVAL